MFVQVESMIQWNFGREVLALTKQPACYVTQLNLLVFLVSRFSS